MKTILITGTHSGVGKETAKLFASKGWNVIAGMRDPKQDKTFTDMENVKVVKLDVTNLEDIEKTAKEILDNGGLDVVFNNAGIGVKGCLDATPIDAIQDVFKTDLMGPIQIMKAFIPYFKNERKGMLIATSSLSGEISFPYDSVYAAAKHALTGLCESLYYELQPYDIKVKLIVPGPINTSFKMKTFNSNQNLMPARRLSKILIPDFNKITEPKEVAQAVYEAATSDNNQFEYIVGDVASELIAKYRAEGVEKFKDELSAELFNK